jgi:hypothetical protein
VRELKKSEKTLHADLRWIKLFLARQPKKPLLENSELTLHRTEKERWHQFIEHIHASGLFVHSINTLSEKKVNEALSIRASVEGQLQQIYIYLLELENQRNAFIKNFSLKLKDRDKLQLDFDILLFGESIFSSNHAVRSEIKNQFCKMVADNQFQENLSSVPIAQMKMVGYVKRANHFQAWIASPKSIFSIERGMLLGKEKARVIDIPTEQVSAVLSDKKKIVIKIID